MSEDLKNRIINSKKLYSVASPIFVIGLLSFAVVSFGNNGPAVTDTEPFALVAENSIHLSDSAQVSSGDIASNKSIRISENGIVNGDLYSDRIQLTENTSINGNIFFNRLIKAETAEVFGEEEKGISKNVVTIPQIQPFQTGNQNLTVGEDTTIDPGSYNQIEVKEGATLTLTLGIYNLNRLTLKDNSNLIYSGDTTVNVRNQIQAGNNLLIASGDPNSSSTTELQINYTGRPPVTIGNSSFVTAKILSPKTRVHLGDNTTFRGQIFAGDVRIGEGGVVSRELFYEKESDPDKVIEGEEFSFIANEILILFEDEAMEQDMLEVAALVDGTITGFIDVPKIVKLEVQAETEEELDAKIQIIEDSENELIIAIAKNVLANESL